VTHLANIRDLLRGLVEAAGVKDPDVFARQGHVLMTGSIIAVEQGDHHAAERAREVGILVLHHHGITV
jgi:hypothetical protein